MLRLTKLILKHTENAPLFIEIVLGYYLLFLLRNKSRSLCLDAQSTIHLGTMPSVKIEESIAHKNNKLINVLHRSDHITILNIF